MKTKLTILLLFIWNLSFGQNSIRIAKTDTITELSNTIIISPDYVYHKNTINFYTKDTNNVALPYFKVNIGDSYDLSDSTGLLTVYGFDNSYSVEFRRAGFLSVYDTIAINSDTTITMNSTYKLLFDDYYLPSYNDLVLVNNIKDTVTTWSHINQLIWSSSEKGVAQPNLSLYSNIWITPPSFAQNVKSTGHVVLPIRDFSSTDIYGIGQITKSGGVVFNIVGNVYYEIYPWMLGEENWKEDISPYFYNPILFVWSNITETWGGTSYDVGTGQSNTDIIINQDGHTTSSAITCDTLIHYPSHLFYNNYSTSPLITIVFDDGIDDVYTDWLPLCNSLNIIAVSAVVTDLVETEGYVTWAQLHELENAGWEIASHSKSHLCFTGERAGYDRPTNSVVIAELSESQQILSNAGFVCRNFVWPFGNNDLRARQYASQYYRSARDYAIVDDDETEINEDGVNLFSLRSAPGDVRRDITGDEGMNEMKAYVDDIYADNKWLIITFHSYDVDKAIAFQELIEYIQSKNIDIVTIDQGIDLVQ